MDISTILANDPELRNEIIKIYSSKENFKINKEEKFKPKALVNRARELNEIETLEVFIRPTLLVKDDDFSLPSSTTFVNRIGKEPFRKNIQKAILASGRLDMEGKDVHLGTAWVVAPGIIVTNRHVLTEKGEEKVLYSDIDIVGKTTIDFKQEHKQEHDIKLTKKFSIKKVLYRVEEFDIAFLQVEVKNSAGQELPTPILLTSQEIKKDKNICVVGYPAIDTKYPNKSFMHQLFDGELKNGIYRKGIYNFKRVSPGQIREIRQNEITHDCCTLGGSSGSVVFAYEQSEAVGIHYSGIHTKYDDNNKVIEWGKNLLIPSSIIAEKLNEAKKHLI